MTFNELPVGAKYVYPLKRCFEGYSGVWMKIHPIYQNGWQAVCVAGDNIGSLVDHEGDLAWNYADVITALDLV